MIRRTILQNDERRKNGNGPKRTFMINVQVTVQFSQQESSAAKNDEQLLGWKTQERTFHVH